jgi:hypothetical protein
MGIFDLEPFWKKLIKGLYLRHIKRVLSRATVEDIPSFFKVLLENGTKPSYFRYDAEKLITTGLDFMLKKSPGTENELNLLLWNLPSYIPRSLQDSIGEYLYGILEKVLPGEKDICKLFVWRFAPAFSEKGGDIIESRIIEIIKGLKFFPTREFEKFYEFSWNMKTLLGRICEALNEE